MNVLINLPGVKDAEKASYFGAEGQKMYEEASVISSRCFSAITESL